MRNLIHTPRHLGRVWPSGTNLESLTVDGEWHLATPRPPSADGFLSIPSSWVPLRPGAIYTVLARVRVYGGALAGQSNGLWFYIAGAIRAQAHPPAGSGPGEYDLRMTFRAPQDLSGLTSLRLYTGRSYPAAWTNMMLVEGLYSGGYADGDTPGWVWTGERGNSPSIGPGVIT